ncbi:MAG: hypothetical protein WDO74_37410 [Pseudomonadota bacterium]
MLKVSLPGGLTVEGDNPQQVAEMLDYLGVPVGRPRALETQPIRHHHWAPKQVEEFVAGLPQQTGTMIATLLRSEGEMPTNLLAKLLELPDQRGIGPLLAAIRRRAEALGLPNPIASELAVGDQPGRSLRLSDGFREAAQTLFPGIRP